MISQEEEKEEQGLWLRLTGGRGRRWGGRRRDCGCQDEEEGGEGVVIVVCNHTEKGDG